MTQKLTPPSRLPLPRACRRPAIRGRGGRKVQVPGHLDQRAGDVRVADVVLALVGVDVPVVPPAERRESLVRIAMSAFDRYIADVDLVGHRCLPPGRHDGAASIPASSHAWSIVLHLSETRHEREHRSTPFRESLLACCWLPFWRSRPLWSAWPRTPQDPTPPGSPRRSRSATSWCRWSSGPARGYARTWTRTTSGSWWTASRSRSRASSGGPRRRRASSSSRTSPAAWRGTSLRGEPRGRASSSWTRPCTGDEFAIATFASGARPGRGAVHLRDLGRCARRWRAGRPGARPPSTTPWPAVPDISLEGHNPKRFAILITDGVDNASQLTPEQAREIVRQAQLPVYVIGLGLRQPLRALRPGEEDLPLRRRAEPAGRDDRGPLLLRSRTGGPAGGADRHPRRSAAPVRARLRDRRGPVPPARRQGGGRKRATAPSCSVAVTRDRRRPSQPRAADQQ